MVHLSSPSGLFVWLFILVNTEFFIVLAVNSDVAITKSILLHPSIQSDGSTVVSTPAVIPILNFPGLTGLPSGPIQNSFGTDICIKISGCRCKFVFKNKSIIDLSLGSCSFNAFIGHAPHGNDIILISYLFIAIRLLTRSLV